MSTCHLIDDKRHGVLMRGQGDVAGVFIGSYGSRGLVVVVAAQGAAGCCGEGVARGHKKAAGGKRGG